MKKTEIKVRIAEIINKIVGENLNTKQSIELNLKANNMNLYFQFHRYQADLDILLYKDGNINIRLKSDRDEYMIEYYKFDETDILLPLSSVIERELRSLFEVYFNNHVNWLGIVLNLKDNQIKGASDLNKGSKWIEEFIEPLKQSY